MPRFVFTGLVATVYPETRDAQDRPLGLTEPGTEREFATAPDQWWVPADGSGDPAEQAGAPGEPAGASDAGVPAAAGPDPSGPVPAPPAVVPPAA